LLGAVRAGRGVACRGPNDLRPLPLAVRALLLLVLLAEGGGLAAADGGVGALAGAGAAAAAAAAAARGRAGARVEAGGGHQQTADLALRGVVDHEALALAVDAVDQAALVGARVE